MTTFFVGLSIALIIVLLSMVWFIIQNPPGPVLCRQFLATKPSHWQHYHNREIIGFKSFLEDREAVVYSLDGIILLFFTENPKAPFVLGSVRTFEWRHFKRIAVTVHKKGGAIPK